MPIGTGTTRLRNVPAVPFKTDPATFNRLTRRQELVPSSFAAPGGGSFTVQQLPQSGIIGKLKLIFDGTLVVTNGGGTTTTRWKWPYGIVDTFKLSANFQDGLFSSSGVDLDVLRFLRNPAFEDATDNYPGTKGGGDSLADTTGTRVYLTWDIPVAVDMVSLIGALYAQSNRTNITVRIDQAADADLFDLTGAATVSLSGTFYIAETMFDIPFDSDGSVVVPDMSRLHGFGAFEVPYSNTGDVVADLINVNGQMLRMLVQVRPDADSYLSPAPGTSSDWESLAMEYGGNKQPVAFDPVEILTAINNEHYGAPLPYGYLALDFARENALRDAVLMRGVTDLRAVVGIASGVTVGSNAAVRIVQETLFQ